MKKVRKILAICLSCIMLVSLCEITVRADEITPGQQETLEEEVHSTEENEPAAEINPVDNAIENNETIEDISETCDVDDTELVDIPDHVDGTGEVGKEDNIPIDGTVFPDAVFRQYVFDNFDTNKNWVLSQSEIEAVTDINVKKKDISNLKGIKVFTSLKNLNCGSNRLTSLDVSGCTSLQELYCEFNQLSELDVSACSNLRELYCDYNQLTRLDVSGLTLLRNLLCFHNQLSVLNVSGCSALLTLHCSENRLTSLDVRGCELLTLLTCDDNNLLNLNLDGCKELEQIYCYKNYLTSLNVGECSKLRSFACYSNPFEKVVVNADLYDVYRSVRPITENGHLVYYRETSDARYSLMVDKNILIFEGIEINETNFLDENFRQYLHNNIDNNSDGYINSFEIENTTKIDVSSCSISNLDGIGYFSFLTELHCGRNNLTNLDVSSCTALESLYCGDNHLTGLNVSGCKALKQLNCATNQLKSLDLSSCSVLNSTNCCSNQLTKLNVSGCTQLTYLECQYNRLKNLDVSGCSSLQYLYCYNNQLTNLNLAGCTVIQNLYCENNNLASLFVGKNEKLADAYLHGERVVYSTYIQYTKSYLNDLAVDMNTMVIGTSPVTEEFSDVKEGAWYVRAVQYVYDYGIMGGKGTSFQPNAKISREEFVRVLYNHAGTPAVTIENPYADVKAGAWYEKAVLWAKEKDIANGKVKDGKSVFGVGANITREEMALMFYKYAKLNGYSLAKDNHAIDGFSDAGLVSTWAKDAMNWAVSNGVMSGKSGNLDPKGNATRAECTSMFKNMIEKTAK